MFKNYILITLRQLFRERFFTAINIGGLVLGMTTAILLLQYVGYEWNHNQHPENVPNKFRLLSKSKATDRVFDQLPPALIPLLKENFPVIEKAGMMAPRIGGGVVAYQEEGSVTAAKTFREDFTVYADNDFFEVYGNGLMKGTVALNQPNTVLISEKYAQKYFGYLDPIGKILKHSNQFGNHPFTVTGIFKDLPEQTDYPFDFLFSVGTFRNADILESSSWVALDQWHAAIYLTILELAENTDSDALAQQITDLMAAQQPEWDVQFTLQPLSEVHLGASLADTNPTFGERSIVLSLLAIALLILFIAWINYVNLTIAQGWSKLKEIGVRKTIGATRLQVAGQFLFKAIFINLLSIGLVLLFVEILQPFFNELVGVSLHQGILLESGFWKIIVAVLLVGTLISGTYAGSVLTAFQPHQVLKGTNQLSAGNRWFRQGLIVFQFAISIALIVSAVVLNRQIDFMKDQDLGMNIEQLLILRGPSVKYEDSKNKAQTFVNEIANQAWVQEYCLTGSLPGNTFTQNFNAAGFSTTKSVPDTDKKSFPVSMIDDRYVSTYKIDLAAGQNFSSTMVEKGWSAEKILLNETAAKALGFETPSEAIGELVDWDGNYEVVGVLKDYHHRGLQQEIDPMIFLPSVNTNLFTIRTTADNMSTKLADLKTLYTKVYPADPFEYYFADEDFASQYAEEKQLSNMSFLASFLAILISCLGLLGLVAYAVERRTKEIGIRKVLGAGIASIISLVAKDFVKLVIFALLIAVPLSWTMMDNWLSNFAYHIEVEWWMFAIAGLVAMSIAFLTVSFQSVKAAMVNPIESLRSE